MSEPDARYARQDPRRRGLVADPRLCPVFDVPGAGCACSGACCRPATPEEMAAGPVAGVAAGAAVTEPVTTP